MFVMKYLFIISFLILTNNKLLSQVLLDSLEIKTKTELIEKYERTDNNQLKKVYLDYYIKKSKVDNDTSSLIDGYGYLSDLYKKEKKGIEYIDSIIKLTQNNPTSIHPTYGYIQKGQKYLFIQNNMKLALDNFLLAREYSLKYPNPQMNFSSNYLIGLIKDKIGYPEEAIEIHKNNLEFVIKEFKEPTKKLFSSTCMQALAFTYKNLGEIDSAFYYNQKGMNIAYEIESESLINHFLLNKGVIFYYQSKFEKSKTALKKSLRYFKKTGDDPNLAEGYFYLSKVFYNEGNNEKFIYYLKNVDSIFIRTKNIPFDVRETYELLVDHAESIGDTRQQLIYLNRLITLDSILSSNKNYLSKNLKNKYDIPRLLSQKETLISKLKDDKINSKYISIIIAVVLVLLILGLYLRQKKLKNKFDKVMNQHNDTKEEIIAKKTEQNEKLEVPNEIKDRIIKKIKTFIDNDKFTDKNLTLSSMSKSFQTNTTYLSKTINYYYKKSFTNFINDLRVEYAIRKLKTEPAYRKYTIRAIAHESGFKSAETFSKFFKRKAGIYPSFFIKKLNSK